jgi:hypothetical protein
MQRNTFHAVNPFSWLNEPSLFAARRAKPPTTGPAFAAGRPEGKAYHRPCRLSRCVSTSATRGERDRARVQARPISLVKGDFGACPKRNPRTVVRQLWGNGKGNFRTRGRFAAATVRGTISLTTEWLTTDTCDGTLVRVGQGVVAVTDLVRRRLVTVRAGQSYLTRP